jgi:hypothetical protein
MCDLFDLVRPPALSKSQFKFPRQTTSILLVPHSRKYVESVLADLCSLVRTLLYSLCVLASYFRRRLDSPCFRSFLIFVGATALVSLVSIAAAIVGLLLSFHSPVFVIGKCMSGGLIVRFRSAISLTCSFDSFFRTLFTTFCGKRSCNLHSLQSFSCVGCSFLKPV